MKAIPAWARSWSASSQPQLTLALQGGGAHGAFTWGVLDRLLESAPFGFEGLSGSSAGAMNAVVFAEGWRRGGRDGARTLLAEFWSALGRLLPFEWLTHGDGEGISLSSLARGMLKWASLFSPEQLNPFDHSALRDLLVSLVNFDALRHHSPFKLFIAATQANTGRLRVFRERELSADVMLATSCLPRFHRAVTIDGEPYWDGGYAANPAVFPLVCGCKSRDLMLVLLSPLRHEQAPRSAEEINERILELGFSANFGREMRMFSDALGYAGGWPGGRLERRLRAQRFHMIAAQGLASMQRNETKLIAHAPFLELLRDQGRERAQEWLDENAGAVGRRSTLDLHTCFG